MKETISWQDFERKMIQVFGRNCHNVDGLYFNVIKENRIGERIRFKDDEVLRYLQELYNMTGELYVVTDYCYEHNHGPFIVRANEIESFVNTFKDIFGMPFYSTDVIIVNFEKKILWVFFHEGICWVSKN